MSKKQKLELTWIGKEKLPKLEPRILIEDSEKSYHAKHKVTENDIFDNILIHGDNLLALKALEQKYTGKVKCIYIDPPYNTGSAFEHYDDGIEHSIWLSLMRDRLVILRNLLSEDGSIWLSIDDNECHYLKVMMDEIFGRACFVISVIWEKADSPRNSARQFSSDHDYVLVYSKQTTWIPNRLPRTKEANSIYTNPDNDPKGVWLPGDPYANKPYSKGLYTVKGPTGREFTPPPGRFWRISEDKLWEYDREGRIWWGPKGNARPSIKRYLSEVAELVPRTLWNKKQVGSNRTSKNEMRALFPGESSFGTPKPEQLIERIIHIATKPGDLVLDSFLGSGTTAAVAHKMGRRWIGIELGEHCYTHCIPRLKKVIDGEDLGGITKTSKKTEAVKLCKSCKESLCDKCAEKVGESSKGGEQKWFGGGGFRFYELGPSLIKEDEWGNPVINNEFNPAMLAEAMCKLEGFTYAPSDEYYWIHGNSSETDYIYVTTQFVSKAMLDKLSDDVGAESSLLICCSAFKADPKQFPNLTIKKIPKAVLKKCEWGRDDYSLEIKNLPDAPETPELLTQEKEEKQNKKSNRKFGKGKDKPKQLMLFDLESEN